jgi:hypothetical protein
VSEARLDDVSYFHGPNPMIASTPWHLDAGREVQPFHYYHDNSTIKARLPCRSENALGDPLA